MLQKKCVTGFAGTRLVCAIKINQIKLLLPTEKSGQKTAVIYLNDRHPEQHHIMIPPPRTFSPNRPKSTHKQSSGFCALAIIYMITHINFYKFN